MPLGADDYRTCASDERFRDALLVDVAKAHDLDVAEPGDIRWVPQGGACGDARAGVAMLADELADDLRRYERCRVVVPAGTGTTALFLAQRLADVAPQIEVLAVPCATNRRELERQMTLLDAGSTRAGVFPTVLELPPRDQEPPHRFGAPAQRELDVWRELATAGLHVDLVYAPHAVDTLLRTLEDPSDDGTPVCYVHCGGVEGVATQLTRYRRLGLVADGAL